MLVDCVLRSCTPIQLQIFAKFQMTHTRSGRLCNFELQIMHLCTSLSLSLPFPSLPSPPSWLALVSTEVGKYLHWVSLWDGAWWWLSSLGCHGYLHPAQGLLFTWHHHLLSRAPSSSSSIGDEFNYYLVYTINQYIAVRFILEDLCWVNFDRSLFIAS